MGVECAGDQFLARAALSGNEYGYVTGRAPTDDLVDVLHRPAGTEEGCRTSLWALGWRVRNDRRRFPPQDVCDQALEAVDLKGLGQILHGVEGGSADGGLGGGKGGHHDHW